MTTTAAAATATTSNMYANVLKSQALRSLGSGGGDKIRPATGNTVAVAAATGSAGQLIDSKFNELAKKILDELKQVQYSKDFFQAIDDILKEPVVKNFTHIYQHHQQQKQQQREQMQQQRHRLQSLNSDNSQSLFQQRDSQQPRSLPVEISNGPRQQQQLQLQTERSKNNQSTQTDFKAAFSNVLVASSGAPPPQQQLSTANINAVSNNSYPLSKSATVGSDDARLFTRRQDAVSSLSSPSRGHHHHHAQPAVIREASNRSPSSGDKLYGQQKNYSANNISRVVASYQIDEEMMDQEDVDDDDDEEDDDDEDEDYSAEFSSYDHHQHRHRNQQQQQLLRQHQSNTRQDNRSHLSQVLDQQQQQQRVAKNPIIKSKTLSDANNIIESIMTTTSTNRQPTQPLRTSGNTNAQHQIRQQQQQQQQQPQQIQQDKQKQRFGYPLVRSSTISGALISSSSGGGSGSHPRQQQPQRQQPQRTDSAEPRSMNLLSHKDMGFLYKPHMNYSTSVCGNHRLSDDDEIIIIPTQSPSLVSTSPDAGEAAGDEPTERFSISRTKSFWEKLTSNKSANSKVASPTSAAAGKDIGSSGLGSNIGSEPAAAAAAAAAMKSSQRDHHGGNRVIGIRPNGHSHPLDRMDSTGGSNSNHSCSSSGDENNCSSSSQRQLNPSGGRHSPEMSRQSILRQTR